MTTQPKILYESIQRITITPDGICISGSRTGEKSYMYFMPIENAEELIKALASDIEREEAL